MSRRFEMRQLAALQIAFEASDHLTRDGKAELAAATGLDVEQVASWFNRQRSQKRSREDTAELERALARLQEALSRCRAAEAALTAELEVARKREAELVEENRCLKERFAVVTSDRQIEALLQSVCRGYNRW